MAAVWGFLWGLAGYYLALMLVTNLTSSKIIRAVILTSLYLIYGIFFHLWRNKMKLISTLILKFIKIVYRKF
jgi:hypothetical protein